MVISKRQLAVETFEALESHEQTRIREQWPCNSCGGDGFIDESTCSRCGGRGCNIERLEELG